MTRISHYGRLTCAVLLLAGAAASAQTYTKLRDLGTQSGDPLNPAWIGVFAQARDGNLYSTSQGGGANAFGTVFRLTPSGTMTRLWSFANGSDGAFPNSGLTLGTDGNLYGSAVNGGLGFGTLFKITTGGTLTPLHSFNGSTEGMQPNSPPIQGNDGNFYGATGNGFNSVFGTIYRMTPSGSTNVIYTFDGVAPHGRYPRALVLGTDGAFYGTARGGGANNNGMIFRITATGAFTPLHLFTGMDGQFPDGAIVQASDGNFYGTTRAGGIDGLGVIYKMTPTGNLTVLRHFHELDGLGYAPFAGLVQATDGKLYGAATGPSRGLLYQITTSGDYAVVHPFSGPDGQSAQVSLFQQTGGVLYGDTSAGGIGNIGCVTCGVLYSLDMGLGPFVSIVNWSGKTGRTVQILGQGLGGTTKVSFHGTDASFTVLSSTFLTAVVPAGATTGVITVSTPGGLLKSSRKFLVVPSITSFTPPSGPIGTPVIITGASFTGARKVAFAQVSATFTVDSDDQISTTVPLGAVTGKIQVTTPGGKASSAADFTVTP
jgi:uncharacterized repeat protein (TIGR03803 family)